MTQEQLEILLGLSPERHVIRVSDLKDQSDRTLLFGYAVDRSAWHVYLAERVFGLVAYRGPNLSSGFVDWRLSEELDIEALDIRPMIRLCSETCDFEFCQLLVRHGLDLPLMPYRSDRVPAQFYGELLAPIDRHRALLKAKPSLSRQL